MAACCLGDACLVHSVVMWGDGGVPKPFQDLFLQLVASAVSSSDKTHDGTMAMAVRTVASAHDPKVPTDQSTGNTYRPRSALPMDLWENRTGGFRNLLGHLLGLRCLRHCAKELGFGDKKEYKRLDEACIAYQKQLPVLKFAWSDAKQTASRPPPGSISASLYEKVLDEALSKEMTLSGVVTGWQSNAWMAKTLNRVWLTREQTWELQDEKVFCAEVNANNLCAFQAVHWMQVSCGAAIDDRKGLIPEWKSFRQAKCKEKRGFQPLDEILKMRIANDPRFLFVDGASLLDQIHGRVDIAEWVRASLKTSAVKATSKTLHVVVSLEKEALTKSSKRAGGAGFDRIDEQTFQKSILIPKVQAKNPLTDETKRSTDDLIVVSLRGLFLVEFGNHFVYAERNASRWTVYGSGQTPSGFRHTFEGTLWHSVCDPRDVLFAVFSTRK